MRIGGRIERRRALKGPARHFAGDSFARCVRRCTNCTDVQIQLCTSVQFIGDNNFDVKIDTVKFNGVKNDNLTVKFNGKFDSAFDTGFYTSEDDESAGRQSAQAENEAVKIASRTVSETRCYGLLVLVHEARNLGNGKAGFCEVRRYLPNRLDLSLSIERAGLGAA